MQPQVRATPVGSQHGMFVANLVYTPDGEVDWRASLAEAYFNGWPTRFRRGGTREDQAPSD